MAVTYNDESTESIELGEAAELLRAQQQAHVEPDFDLAARLVKRLANNRAFVASGIAAALKETLERIDASPYAAPVFLLHFEKGFAIRANVWMPPAAGLTRRALEDEVLSYQVFHDHNFDFVTAGYAGPGYRTSIYEYDGRVGGYIGEKVPLKFLEDTMLPQGKVMMFRRGRDIHSQLYPDELSISLNILFQSDTRVPDDAYTFDIAADVGTITSYSGSPDCAVVSLLDMARCLPGDKTADVIAAMSASHQSGRVRAASYEALAKLAPAATKELLRAAVEDRSPHVQQWVSGYESCG